MAIASKQPRRPPPTPFAVQAQHIVMETIDTCGYDELFETHQNVYRPGCDVASKSDQATYLAMAFDIVAKTCEANMQLRFRSETTVAIVFTS